MIDLSQGLVSWENGVDLVIEVPFARPREIVWKALIDGAGAAEWFAPFTLTEVGDGDQVIVFDLGETELEGEILSCEEGEHVLLDLDDFGVIGLRLVAAEDTGHDGLLVFTQTTADLESARRLADDQGPMWDTHLRLFARSLGLDVAEVDEAAITEIYANLEVIDASDEDGDE